MTHLPKEVIEARVEELQKLFTLTQQRVQVLGAEMQQRQAELNVLGAAIQENQRWLQSESLADAPPAVEEGFSLKDLKAAVGADDVEVVEP
jgi:hypothetical protein